MKKVALLIVVVALTVTVGHANTNSLPSPSHAIDFGYWYADGRYGDVTREVFPYTNMVVEGPGLYDTAEIDAGHWQALVGASLSRAASANKKILLLLGVHDADAFPDASPSMTPANILDVAADYWSSVTLVEIYDEPASDYDIGADVTTLFAALDGRGLS